MHPYNPTPVLDTSFNVPDDGDLAAVASIIALLDLADASKFFADLLDGTTAGVTLESPTITGTAQIEVANFTTGLSIASDKIVAVDVGLILNTGVVLEVGGATILHAALTGTTAQFTGLVDCDANLNVDGSAQIDFALTVGGLATLDSVNIGNASNILGDETLWNFTTVPVRHAGELRMVAGGHIDRHMVTVANSDTAYTIASGEIFRIPAGHSPRTYTLQNTGASPNETSSMIWFAEQASPFVLKQHNGSTTIATLDAAGGSGTYRWIMLVNDGAGNAATSWHIVGGQLIP